MKQGKLTPEQIARFWDKMQSGGPGIVVKDGKARYYSRSFPGSNIYRVLGHEYSYLDHHSGNWIPHPAVCDAVIGYGGDTETCSPSLLVQTSDVGRSCDVQR